MRELGAFMTRGPWELRKECDLCVCSSKLEIFKHEESEFLIKERLSEALVKISKLSLLSLFFNPLNMLINQLNS